MKKLQNLVNSELTKSIENYDKQSAFVYKLMYLDPKKHNIWVVAKKQQLTLMTDNPYLGTQLRYQQEKICEELNKKFLMQLTNSKVKIIPPSVETKKPKKDLFTVGDKASEVLKIIANEIKDEELKNSLLKLTVKNTSQ